MKSTTIESAAVIAELRSLWKWVKDGRGYERDDAPDEIARAIDNRIRQIDAHGWNNPEDPSQSTLPQKPQKPQKSQKTQ